MSAIDKKEYLKKYLSSSLDKEKKKKKKKKLKGILQNRVKIIDDDIDIITSFTEAVKEDLAGGEDENAPQIVHVYDERPVDLRQSEFKDESVWEVIDIKDDKDDDSINGQIKREPLSPSDNADNYTNDYNNLIIKQEDYSPDRNQSNIRGDDLSPPRRRLNRNEDLSPPRRRKSNKDDHNSPHRNRSQKHHHSSPSRKKNIDHSPRFGNRRHREDLTPSRKSRFDSEEDCSPPRRNKTRKYDDDLTPTRDNYRNLSPPAQNNKSNKNTRDLNPQRRRKLNTDDSPEIRLQENDISPPRKRTIRNTSPSLDLSPRRRRKLDNGSTSSENRRRHRDQDLSPSRKSRRSTSPRKSDHSHEESKSSGSKMNTSDNRRRNKDKSSRWGSAEASTSKMDKTLDGKRAGLQNARDLAQETQQFKRKEDETFANMSENVSGVNASAVLRDRKTGRIRNLEEEAREKEEKQQKEAQIKEKYDRWGKGLKQVENYQQRLEEDLHEMSKPLARYADDQDLESHLKSIEREGDPMLNYIRKKKKKESIESGKPVKPQYNGEFMPNRYGIPPGHRWDGVNRSNGYETRWITSINERNSLRNEAYKWNSEDM